MQSSDSIYERLLPQRPCGETRDTPPRRSPCSVEDFRCSTWALRRCSCLAERAVLGNDLPRFFGRLPTTSGNGPRRGFGLLLLVDLGLSRPQRCGLCLILPIDFCLACPQCRRLSIIAFIDFELSGSRRCGRINRSRGSRLGGSRCWRCRGSRGRCGEFRRRCWFGSRWFGRRCRIRCRSRMTPSTGYQRQARREKS